MSTIRHSNVGEIKLTLGRQHSSLDLTRFLCIKFTYQHSRLKKNHSFKKNYFFKLKPSVAIWRKKSNVWLRAYKILLAHAVAIHSVYDRFFRQIKGQYYIFGRNCILPSKFCHLVKINYVHLFNNFI